MGSCSTMKGDSKTSIQSNGGRKISSIFCRNATEDGMDWRSSIQSFHLKYLMGLGLFHNYINVQQHIMGVESMKKPWGNLNQFLDQNQNQMKPLLQVTMLLAVIPSSIRYKLVSQHLKMPCKQGTKISRLSEMILILPVLERQMNSNEV